MSYDQEHHIDRAAEERQRADPRRNLEAHIEEILEALGLHGEEPPSHQVSQQFLDSLERVDRKKLGPGDECAICAVPHLDDEYPLVVALPCQGRHRFDLECVSQWLQRSTTCPMCRTDLMKKPKIIPVVEDDEEEYDDMYG